MVDLEGLLIGFIPAAAAASITGFIAYMKDKRINWLNTEHEKRITQLKMDHEIEMRGLEDKLDTLKAYDTDLRSRRIDAYTKLWFLLEPLSHYNRPEPVTYELILDMWTSIREWYYRIGGIYLSEKSRISYFFFLDEIIRILREEVLKKKESKDDIVFFYEQCRRQVKEEPIGKLLIPADSLQRLIEGGHNLKVDLVEDIGTRTPPRYPPSGYDNK
jgi:hypothetical protein